MYGKSYQVTYWEDPGEDFPGQNWVVLEITWGVNRRHKADPVSRHYNRPGAEAMAEFLWVALDA